MKPELPAVVYFRPKVCKRYPSQRKTPAAKPPRKPRQTARAPAWRKAGSKSSNMHPLANAKRSVRKYMVEILCSACLTSTKVVPQIKATRARVRSAFQRAGGLLTPTDWTGRLVRVQRGRPEEAARGAVPLPDDRADTIRRSYARRRLVRPFRLRWPEAPARGERWHRWMRNRCGNGCSYGRPRPG